MINLTDLNKRIAPYTASAHLTTMTDLDFFGFVVTVTAPDGRKMASATDEQRMIEPVVLSLIEMLEAQMNTKEFEDTYEPTDMVNSPAHYMHGGIETIELIKAFLTPEEFRGYLKGNVIKYRERAPYKGQMEQDYKKGARYWEWLQAETKGENR